MSAPRPDAGASTDLVILQALRGQSTGYVSGAELAERLGLTRSAIWARMQELRQRGYDIEASPQHGYRLVSSPDALVGDDLLARLGRGTIIGRQIQVFRETRSTNDVVERLARDGVGEGVVVFAESQTQGRGRLGRSWVSPAGKGLWFSVLLRPRLLPGETTRIVILAAVAMVRALRAFRVPAIEIKWPNDILCRGRKLVGVLTEMQAELDLVRHVVLGIGVNANLEAGDFPPAVRPNATSLRIEGGQPVDRAALAVTILRELDQAYRRLSAGDFESLAAEWAASCGTLGKEVCIRVGDRLIRGRAEALDDTGALLVRTEHGRLEAVVGGEVTLVH